MSKAQEVGTATIFGLIIDGDSSKFLSLADGQSPSLPVLTMDGGIWPTNAGKVEKGLKEAAGADLNVLVRLSYRELEDNKDSESLYLLELADSCDVQGIWFDFDQVHYIKNTSGSMLALLKTEMEKLRSSRMPDQRPAWTRPGWRQRSTNWVEKELATLGKRVVDPIETVQNWSISYVMKAKTENGNYYFKTSADLPLFVNEARVVSGLGQIFADQVPTVVAHDFERNWLLMKDSGDPIGWDAPVHERKALIQQYCQFQKEAAEQVPYLLKIGCLDRRLGWLKSKIDDLVHSPESGRSLGNDESAQLKAMSPDLKDMVDQLAEFNIPQSLVHGDLHGGNVAWTREKLVYFDWTDACISHPFFDMVDIFQEKDLALQRRLTAHCLQQWTDYEPISRLRSAWDIAQVLAAVNQAISYHEILVNIDPAGRHELDWGLPFWLRKIVSSFEQSENKNDR